MLELYPRRDIVQEVKPSEPSLGRECQLLVQQSGVRVLVSLPGGCSHSDVFPIHISRDS